MVDGGGPQLAQLGLERGLLAPPRPVAERLRVLAELVEARGERVPGDLVALPVPAAQLLVRRVGGDAVDPAPEGGLTLEGVDIAGDRPEGVLHHFLRVLLVAGDS